MMDAAWPVVDCLAESLSSHQSHGALHSFIALSLMHIVLDRTELV